MKILWKTQIVLSLRFMFEKANIDLTSQLEIERRPTRRGPWGLTRQRRCAAGGGAEGWERPWVSLGRGPGPGREAVVVSRLRWERADLPASTPHAALAESGQADRPGAGGVTAPAPHARSQSS